MASVLGRTIERAGRAAPQPWTLCTLRSLVLLRPPGGRSSGAMAGDGEEDGGTTQRESFRLLGILDVRNTPCARESVLFGSVGALSVGLGHFLATSRVRRSCDFGVGGFILTTFGCWVYCRYNNAKLRIQQQMIKEGMRNKILYESTQFDPEKQKNKD